MANMPDTNNRNLCVRVPRYLYYKIKRSAAEHGMDMAAFVRWVLAEATVNVQLTSDDIRRIAKEVEDAERKLRG